MKRLVYIGHVAVFYLPQSKLDDEHYRCDGMLPRQLVHEFLMEHYNAYTVSIDNTRGFWRQSKQSRIYADINARYEVSFLGKEKIPFFVEFLSGLCKSIEEEAIYLTMGKKSYLVLPKGRE